MDRFHDCLHVVRPDEAFNQFFHGFAKFIPWLDEMKSGTEAFDCSGSTVGQARFISSIFSTNGTSDHLGEWDEAFTCIQW